MKNDAIALEVVTRDGNDRASTGWVVIDNGEVVDICADCVREAVLEYYNRYMALDDEEEPEDDSGFHYVCPNSYEGQAKHMLQEIGRCFYEPGEFKFDLYHKICEMYMEHVKNK